MQVTLPHGISAYDIDCHPGGTDGEEIMARWQRAHGELPGGLTTGTPQHGRHVYLRVPPGMRLISPGDGVEVKRPGQLLMIAGRTLAGPYCVLDSCPVPDAPGWAIEPVPPAQPRPAGHGRGDPYQRMHGLVARVLAATQGERDDILFWAVCRAGEMAAAGQVDAGRAAKALITAGERTGLPPNVVRAKVMTGLGRTS